MGEDGRKAIFTNFSQSSPIFRIFATNLK